MIPAFWSGLAGKVAERAAVALVSPAFAFWAVGVLAWLASADPALRRARLGAVLSGKQFSQLFAVVLALLVVVGSALVVQRLLAPALILLQGGWPRFLAPVRRVLVARHFRLKERLEADWERGYRETEGARAAGDVATPADRLRVGGAEQRLLDDERRLNAYPPRSERVAPTKLGNVLRAAEGRILDKYGIDAARCWPALWLILPGSTQTAVAEARKELDDCTSWLVWSVLLLLWAPLAWWAVLAAVVGAWIGYLATVQAAARYGELIEAAYAVHRGLLYDSLRWPRPEPASEPAWGQALTAAIWRGPALAEPPHHS